MSEHILWAVIFLSIFFGQVLWMHLEEELQDEWGCKIGAAASLGAAAFSYQKMWFPEGVFLFTTGVFAWAIGCWTGIVPHIKGRWRA